MQPSVVIRLMDIFIFSYHETIPGIQRLCRVDFRHGGLLLLFGEKSKVISVVVDKLAYLPVVGKLIVVE